MEPSRRVRVIRSVWLSEVKLPPLATITRRSVALRLSDQEDPFVSEVFGVQPIHVQDEPVHGAGEDPLLDPDGRLLARHVEDQGLQGVVAPGEDPDADRQGGQGGQRAEDQGGPGEADQPEAGAAEGQGISPSAPIRAKVMRVASSTDMGMVTTRE